MAELTKQHVEQWLDLEEPEFSIVEFRAKHGIAPTSKNLNMALTRLCEERKIKRVSRGIYRKIKIVKPVEWWRADEDEELDFVFPCGHVLDDTTFGLDDCVSVSPGDLIVIAGVSNAGKSALCKNILADNIDRFDKCILMGNEYTNLDGTPSPKFKRNLMAMAVENGGWVEWMNGQGPKFDLLPVREDWEDYVVAGALNIIDWINLTDNFYKIGEIVENIKSRIGKGLAVVVIQKDEAKELGRGGGFSRDLADVYFSVDPLGAGMSRLSIGKVKVPKGKIYGRMWGFEISKGAILHNIHEVIKCDRCNGKNQKCIICDGTGYKSKYDDPFDEFSKGG